MYRKKPRPSVSVPLQLVREGLSAAGLRVAIYLLYVASGRGQVAESGKAIAEELGTSIRTARYGLHDLAKRGLIVPYFDGRKTTYFLNF